MRHASNAAVILPSRPPSGPLDLSYHPLTLAHSPWAKFRRHRESTRKEATQVDAGRIKCRRLSQNQGKPLPSPLVLMYPSLKARLPGELGKSARPPAQVQAAAAEGAAPYPFHSYLAYSFLSLAPTSSCSRSIKSVALLTTLSSPFLLYSTVRYPPMHAPHHNHRRCTPCSHPRLRHGPLPGPRRGPDSRLLQCFDLQSHVRSLRAQGRLLCLDGRQCPLCDLRWPPSLPSHVPLRQRHSRHASATQTPLPDHGLPRLLRHLSSGHGRRLHPWKCANIAQPNPHSHHHACLLPLPQDEIHARPARRCGLCPGRCGYHSLTHLLGGTRGGRRRRRRKRGPVAMVCELDFFP